MVVDGHGWCRRNNSWLWVVVGSGDEMMTGRVWSGMFLGVGAT